MSTSKARNKKRGSESLMGKSDPKTRLIDDFDPDLSKSLFTTTVLLCFLCMSVCVLI